VHKPIYASGFLYHSATGQILLQQITQNADTSFTLFSDVSKKGADPQTVFLKCLEKSLGVKIAASDIHAVYDYVPDGEGAKYIFYVEVTDAVPQTYRAKSNAAWLHLSKIGKSNMNEQTRHDIVVGERVIRSLLTPMHVPGSPGPTHN
jgi:hypothetical protein